MRQIKYVFLDYKQRKGSIIILLILSITILFIFNFFAKSFLDSTTSLKSLKKFENQQSFYTVDNTSDDRLNHLMNNKDTIKKELNFFKEIQENYQYIMEYGYEIDILDNGETLNQRSVNQSFFELYNLNLYKGTFFSEDDYSSKKNIIPIIIGYNLKDIYEYGKTYDFINGGTGETFKGKVIGILEINSNFREFNDSETSISLNNSYILPIFNDFKSKDMSFSDIDMALSHLIIFTKNVNQIQEIHNQLNTFETNFINCKDKIDNMLEIQLHNILFFIGILIFLTLLIIFILWTIFNKMIKQQMNEYGIHILCGATHRDIFIRFILFIFIIIFISHLFVIIINGISLIQIFTLCFSLIIGLVSLIYPYFKIKNIDTISIIKL
ncbi:hypothetical protein [Longibaculum muris]|uniref:hypothetical protein n=1 Tax=Longibaculum muris TaxID=1796628 RepID=UPI0022E4C45E|nr:hypothetical protein [Longibaculum muris]